MTSTYDLTFDPDLCVGVADTLVRHHRLDAHVDEYEPGMAQVRIDPTNTDTEHGFVVCPGLTDAGLPSWLALPTTRSAHPITGETYYDTAEGDYGTDLHIDLNAPIDAVAEAVKNHIENHANRADYNIKDC